MPRETLIQVRRGTGSDWSNQNPVLASGELGLEIDSNKLKIGNGQLSWNNLDYINLSQNTIQVKNNLGYSIHKGQAVYISGFDNISSLPTVGLYISNNSLSEYKFVGLLMDYISDGGIGFVITLGILDNINTTGTISNIAIGNESWSTGDTLYISQYDSGKLTKNRPFKSSSVVGHILNSNVTGSIFVKPVIIPKIEQLSNTNIVNPEVNHLLSYNAADSLWINSDTIDGGVV